MDLVSLIRTFTGRATGDLPLLIFLELSAAFDIVDESVFLARLAEMGVGSMVFF